MSHRSSVHAVSDRTAPRDCLEQRVQELEERNRELEAFVRMARHDLKQPLRTVAGFLDLYTRRYGDEIASEDARDLLERARRGAHQCQALLDGLARLEGIAATGLELGTVESEAVLYEALSSLAVSIEETQADIAWGSLPPVVADEALLCQVFQNLVSNAIKYAGDAPPSIRITAHRAESEWRFHVEDQGIGIDPAHAQAVFEPFQRLRWAGDGTGLGLAIVDRIVDRHAGEAWIESEPGQGTRVCFTLPVDPGV